MLNFFPGFEDRAMALFVQCGSRTKKTGGRRGGEKKPHGGYGEGFAQQARARQKYLARLVMGEQLRDCEDDRCEQSGRTASGRRES